MHSKYWSVGRRATEVITPSTTLFWFRRDLRLEDNAGLFHALRDRQDVLGIFIFDTDILTRLDRSDRRVTFILKRLEKLAHELAEAGSSLWIHHGTPLEFFRNTSPASVYANHDYEPYGRTRDEAVRAELASRGIPFLTFKDQVIFEKDEISKSDGRPYVVFTPYSKAWKSELQKKGCVSYPAANFSHLKKTPPLPFPSHADIGFEETAGPFPPDTIRAGKLGRYGQDRDFPARDGTTRLSLHLRFGTVSIRGLVRMAWKRHEAWLTELIWRDFYHSILWHFPRVETTSFKMAYDRIEWRNNEQEFHAWCQGQTGYPIVDAGMRELNATGFMHNRVRMIVASFLTKHLLIDWRWGADYFASRLLDFDLASNNGGWQWAAGTGCDAQPYFRVFNPSLQARKFDPEMQYIKKWVPDIESGHYPHPIVEHTAARERALRVFKKALIQEN